MLIKSLTFKIPVLFYLLIWYSSVTNYAQVLENPSYLIETGTVISGGRQTPFWLLSNQYGLVTTNERNEWIKLGLKTEMSSVQELDFDYGISLVNRYSDRNQLYLQQAYFRMKYHSVYLQVGTIEEKFGNQDSTLSSGGLLWSGNARPFPKSH